MAVIQQTFSQKGLPPSHSPWTLVIQNPEFSLEVDNKQQALCNLVQHPLSSWAAYQLCNFLRSIPDPGIYIKPLTI